MVELFLYSTYVIEFKIVSSLQIFFYKWVHLSLYNEQAELINMSLFPEKGKLFLQATILNSVLNVKKR